MVKIGILAIQGGFSEHADALKKCLSGSEYVEMKLPVELVELRCGEDITSDLNGIILPGGKKANKLFYYLVKQTMMRAGIHTFVSHNESP